MNEEELVEKIGISISRELDDFLNYMSEKIGESKSRLIEKYIQENQYVRDEFKQYKLKHARMCPDCNKRFTKGDIRIYLPKNESVLHLRCWSKKAGKIIEKYPLHDHV